jgi:hypothetical protein
LQIEFELRTNGDTIRETRPVPEWPTLSNEERSRLVYEWAITHVPATDEGWTAGAGPAPAPTKPTKPPWEDRVRLYRRAVILQCIECWEPFEWPLAKGHRPFTCPDCVAPYFRRRAREYAKQQYSRLKRRKLEKLALTTPAPEDHA